MKRKRNAREEDHDDNAEPAERDKEGRIRVHGELEE
jgi:hypothetical protein